MTDWVQYALAKPGAWRDQPFGDDIVAKVGPKIFAFLGGSGGGPVTSVGIKCGDRDLADEWLQRYPDAATKMAYIGQHGWNSLQIGGLIPDDEIADALDTSYELIVAKLPRRIRDQPG